MWISCGYCIDYIKAYTTAELSITTVTAKFTVSKDRHDPLLGVGVMGLARNMVGVVLVLTQTGLLPAIPRILRPLLLHAPVFKKESWSAAAPVAFNPCLRINMHV
jgi:hypothetical protein